MIELLLILSVVAIVVAVLMPAVKEKLEQRQVGKAYADMQAIKAAIDAYYRTYEKLPLPEEDLGGPDTRYIDHDTKKIIKTLLGEYDLDPMVSRRIRNPKKITFLERSSADRDGTFLDPWGNPYIIWMDNNNDGVVALNPNEYETSAIPFKVGAIVQSLGGDGFDEQGAGLGTSDDLHTIDSMY